ncbi:adenosine kinase 2-like [Aplysia californica]|uniref:Adenosine kinase n=1 Tax=Aplysia californica TaxID=6500 RepID=A0ABM0JLL5_APLCA|nr:adenosine kinase 2-like [Aplysia californica]
MASSSGVREGVLLGMGNPLLDISITGNQDLLSRYGLEPNNAVLATPEQHELFHEVVEKFSPSYIAGGATQNSVRVAQWLLQVPGATTFMGGVGNDRFRHILEENARCVGVNVCYQVYPDDKTGVCAAIITGEDRSLITELGAAERFCLDFLQKQENWALVEKARYFYIGGFLLSNSSDVVTAVAKHCSAAKKTLVMNLHATFLCQYFADPGLNLMPHVDVLFGNGDEYTEFARQMNMDMGDMAALALKVAALPKANSDLPRIVIITQGKAPTIVATEGRVEEIHVQPVDTSLIKDTNGCGDAFVGGFLSQLVQGKPLSECLRCGSYAAKIVIQHFGCTYPDHPDFV